MPRTRVDHLFFFAVLCPLIGCAKQDRTVRDEPAAPAPKRRVLSRERIRASIQWLASDARRGRGSFSDDARLRAVWIAERFKESGLHAPAGGYLMPFTRGGKQSRNVVGIVSGRGPEVVLVGAHYDHLGQRGRQIYYGADDNASGVSVLLEVARLLAVEKPERSIWFVAFGAEEKGVAGSRAFVATPPCPLGRVTLMVNLDMLGRGFYENAYGTSMKDGLGIIVHRPQDSIGEFLYKASPDFGLRVMVLPDSFLRRFGGNFYYDSLPFNEKGIPTIFFSTSLHADYHRPSDTPDKIHYGKLARIAGLVLALLKKTTSPPDSSAKGVAP